MIVWSDNIGSALTAYNADAEQSSTVEDDVHVWLFLEAPGAHRTGFCCLKAGRLKHNQQLMIEVTPQTCVENYLAVDVMHGLYI